jgi:hypothetical protein
MIDRPVYSVKGSSETVPAAAADTTVSFGGRSFQPNGPWLLAQRTGYVAMTVLALSVRLETPSTSWSPGAADRHPSR